MNNGNSHFLMALGRHDGGQVIESADQQLREVISAVYRTGRKGTVAVTMTIAPNGEQGLELSCKVAARAPELQFGKSFYFSDRNGDLTRKQPDYVQESLIKAE